MSLIRKMCSWICCSRSSSRRFPHFNSLSTTRWKPWLYDVRLHLCRECHALPDMSDQFFGSFEHDCFNGGSTLSKSTLHQPFSDFGTTCFRGILSLLPISVRFICEISEQDWLNRKLVTKVCTDLLSIFILLTPTSTAKKYLRCIAAKIDRVQICATHLHKWRPTNRTANIFIFKALQDCVKYVVLP